MMKKSRIFAVLAAMAIELVFFGCKAEIETEYVDKTYAEAVTFTAEDAGEAGVKVAMASKTEGVAIYYTTDGTEPTENSKKYTEAVTFDKDTVVKAVAVKEGIENSPVSVANVSIKTKTITEKVYVCAKCQKEYATAQEAIDCCSEKTDTTETASFSVGSVVKIDGLDYTVVSNTITENSGSARSVVAEIGGAALTTLKAIEKTKEYAEKTFGKNVLLIRVAGKIVVKHGTLPEFTELKKNIVPAVIPNGYSESDFFEESKETTPHYFYSDTFLVLGKEDLTDRLGFIKEQWHSKYYANFIDSENNSVAFEDALKAMNFVLIRNYMPNEFKSYDKTVKELYGLLKDAAREQHGQNTSTIQKLRSEDNTKIYIQKPAPNRLCLNIRRSVKQPRLSGMLVELSLQVDGSCRTFIYTRNGDDMPKILSPEMKETLVFLGPEVWDEIVTDYKNRRYGR